MTSYRRIADEVRHRPLDRLPDGDTVYRRIVGLLFGFVLIASFLPTGTTTRCDAETYPGDILWNAKLLIGG